jgi:hypothetical protein
MTLTPKTPDEVAAALAAPFDPEEVHFKPQAIRGTRARAVAYVDARAIQDRLDDVVGPAGWQTDLEFQANGTVLCRLRIRLNGEWLVKADVGGPSDQADEGDRCKAAASDGLKRAAVLWGIGRYLYHLPAQWVDYDPKSKCFTSQPQLPAWAMPGKDAPAPSASRTEAKGLPADGAELVRRLTDYDTQLATQGLCPQGDLMAHVVQAGMRAGYNKEIRTWSGKAIVLAVEETRAFEQAARKKEEYQQTSVQRLAGQGSSKSA